MYRRSALAITVVCFLTACGGDGTKKPSSPTLDGGLDGSFDGGTDASGGGAGGKGGGGASGGGGDAGGSSGSGGQGTGGEPACGSPEECQALCGDDAVWIGNGCAPCPACNNEGELGRWSEPTTTGHCICETEPGYFYSTAGQIGTLLCDSDADGWIKESAREAIESGDPALTENARCELRTVASITLRTEGLHDRTVELQEPLDLYESDRNDVDELLEFRWQNEGLPDYNNTGRPPLASTLNSFTKLCHSAKTDYNDNGIPDVEEYSGHPLPTGKEYLAPFLEFSYFAELHRGFFKAGVGGDPDTYVIQEKSRKLTATAERRVPVKFGPLERSYWRDCTLARDSEWERYEQPVGMDFATYEADSSWEGMNLHSLFKCFLVTDEDDLTQPELATKDELESDDYRINDCYSQGLPTAPGSDNPWDASYACDVIDPSSVQLGRAYWGAARYRDYNIDLGDGQVSPPWNPDLPESYLRGCINACSDPDHGCDPIQPPPPDPNPLFGCVYDPEDFGKQLGCAEQCNNADDDFDGIPDNNTNGLRCQRFPPATSPDAGAPEPYLGDCEFGLTKCQDGVFTCEGLSPGQRLEVCDGRDNDCDGRGDFAEDNGPDPDILGLGNSCSSAVNPETGQLLNPDCRQGFRRCVQPGFSEKPQMLCISDSPDFGAEDPCNQRDDSCDGDTDETFTLWEGDDTSGNLLQCNDGTDDNCDSVVARTTSEQASYGGKLGWRVCYCNGREVDACGLVELCSEICSSETLRARADCTGVPVEICGNEVDDDCDGFVDETFDMVSGKPVAELCRYPCRVNGAKRCAKPSPDALMRIYTQEDIDAMTEGKSVTISATDDALNPRTEWYFYPPFFHQFQKVLICQDGFWRIHEVCGAGNLTTSGGNTVLTDISAGWGGNETRETCVEGASGVSCDTGGAGSSVVWDGDIRNAPAGKIECHNTAGCVTGATPYTGTQTYQPPQ